MFKSLVGVMRTIYSFSTSKQDAYFLQTSKGIGRWRYVSPIVMRDSVLLLWMFCAEELWDKQSSPTLGTTPDIWTYLECLQECAQLLVWPSQNLFLPKMINILIQIKEEHFHCWPSLGSTAATGPKAMMLWDLCKHKAAMDRKVCSPHSF